MRVNLSTVREAEALAADAVDWLAAIRNAKDGPTLNRIAKTVMTHLADRGACDQIRQHFVIAITEERARHGEAKPVSRKEFAAGESAE